MPVVATPPGPWCTPPGTSVGGYPPAGGGGGGSGSGSGSAPGGPDSGDAHPGGRVVPGLVSTLCSKGWRPLLITGLIRDLLVRHFGDAQAERIAPLDFQPNLDAGDEPGLLQPAAGSVLRHGGVRS